MKISSEDLAEKILSTSYDHRTIPHLDDSTIGKHGGELLFYHWDTIKKGNIMILGLFVQETQVGFIACRM